MIHFGAVHTSKPLNEWIQDLNVPVIHVTDGRFADPLSVATTTLLADPATAASDLTKLVAPGPDSFLAQWRSQDDAAIAALADQLLAHEQLDGDQVADTVGFWLRRGV